MVIPVAHRGAEFYVSGTFATAGEGDKMRQTPTSTYAPGLRDDVLDERAVCGFRFAVVSDSVKGKGLDAISKTPLTGGLYAMNVTDGRNVSGNILYSSIPWLATTVIIRYGHWLENEKYITLRLWRRPLVPSSTSMVSTH